MSLRCARIFREATKVIKQNMAILKKEEKEEFLHLAKSMALREDFQNMRRISDRYRGKLSFDEYIDFLNVFNAFINHRRKRVKKMTGNKFKL